MSRSLVAIAGALALALLGLTLAVQLDLPAELDLRVPDWLRWIVKTKKVWLPVLVAGFIVAAELNRRNKVSRDDDRA
jgi:hypothetical protein